jgi:hypothetical protein
LLNHTIVSAVINNSFFFNNFFNWIDFFFAK